MRRDAGCAVAAIGTGMCMRGVCGIVMRMFCGEQGDKGRVKFKSLFGGTVINCSTFGKCCF